MLDRYQAELHRKHYEIDAQGNTKTWTLEEKWKKFKQEARPDLCRPTDPNMKYACDGEDHPYYMQAEVTPDERFYQNSWFALNDPDDPPNAVYDSEADGKSPLVGKNLCTYGPWVRDHGHGKRPEIHPAELLWWREGDSRYLLMQVQDDSNRFDVPLQFEGAGKCRTWDSINSVCDESVVLDEYQAWFRPWAEPPRVSQFRIAFEVDLPSPVGTQLPAYNIPVFDIRELALLRQEAFPDVSHPRVQPHVSDTTPGTDHAVTFNFKVGPFLQKRTVLQVRERVRFSNLLGVRFNQICRDPVRKKLRGFVQLTSAIGRDSKGKEGYQVLGVSRELYPSQGSGPITLRAIKSESPSVRAPLFPRVSAKAKLASGSLRRVEVDGRPQLVADIEVTLTAPEGQPSDKLAITKAEQGDGGQRVVRALKRPDPLPGVGTHGVNPSAVVQKVALNRTSTLAVILQSGEKVKIPLSSTLSLNPRLRTRPLPHPKVDSANWEAWAHATGAPLTSPLPTHMSLLHPPHWEVDMTPVYAPLKEGEPSIEEESPIAEELHEAIRKRNPERLAKVFGSSQPLTIQWSYAATNLITGQAVSVTTNASANPAAVRVAITDGPIPSGTLRITFPNQSKPDLYELVVTATISDTLGNTGSFSERIWSHYLGGTASGRMANPLLQVIAALGGLSPQDVVAALTPLDDDTAVQIAINERLRQLHTLRLFAEEAAEDQVVSFEEFSGLLGMAKNSAGTAK